MTLAAASRGQAAPERPDAVLAAKSPKPGPKPVDMHLGCQRGPTSPAMLQRFRRNGVEHICGYPPEPGPSRHWSREDLERTRDLCDRHGVHLDMVALPFLTSSHIDREKRAPSCSAKAPNVTGTSKTSRR